MTVTLSYDGSLARVAIAATGLSSTDQALVERSTDQLRWSTVRGAEAWPVSAGQFTRTLYDYEFAPGVPNYYRVRALIPSSGPLFVGVSTADTGSSGTRSALLPPGIVNGDTIYMLASSRNSGSGLPDPPAGWTPLLYSGNVGFLGRIWDGVWTAPSVTFSGGAANEDTIEQMWAMRGPGLTVHNSAQQLNASAQNIAVPALTISENNCTLLVMGWKQDDWTSVAALAGLTEIQEAVSIAGNDAGQVVDYAFQTTAASVGAQSFSVTGGAAAISRGMIVALSRRDFLHEQTANLTPVISRPWLKSVARPNLNLAIAPDADTSGPTWSDRSGVFPVKGRSLPIAVTDVRGGREFDLCLQTATLAEGETLRLGQMFGDTVYLQVPPGYPELATGYYVVGPLRRDNRSKDPTIESFWWYLPMREVAAPNPGVVGVTVTCADIVANFADCNAVVAAFATSAAVLDYVAAPADIIVP